VWRAISYEPDSAQRMLRDDLRALTPLIYAHVTSDETFQLDMSQRLAIEEDAVAEQSNRGVTWSAAYRDGYRTRPLCS